MYIKERKNRLISQSGLTLIELMVVIVILGLLAALVAPKMFGRIGEAKQKAAKAQIELFVTAHDTFRLDVEKNPATSEGIQALRVKPSGLENWNGPYLPKEIPLDPWGHAYNYRSPGEHGDYDLYSFGADNAAGGGGENQDIVSWK